MTRPDNCSAAGGSISLWVRVLYCSDNDGIITTRSDSSPTGSMVLCIDNNIG